MRFSHLSILTSLLCFTLSFGQTQQKLLEKERKQLHEEIKQITKILSEIKNSEEAVVAVIGDLSQKITLYKKLIKVTNKQGRIIARHIEDNHLIITKNKKELMNLKSNYANMIHNSYKAHTTQNRIMFLLSSEDFLEGYKRLTYMKQYAKYRRGQGQRIIKKTNEIEQLNATLNKQLIKQNQLKSDNEKAENQLIKDREKQQKLIEKIRNKETNYKALISKKQKEYRLLNEKIDRLIRESIKEVNRKSKALKTKASIFELTPEAKKIAKSFSKNKGKLLWPVERGIIIQKFGEYSDPVYQNIKYFNNGITISCPKKEVARVVHKGIVTGIIKVPGGSKAVQVRHGDYITTYYNLSDIFVRKDQEVKTKDQLGQIFMNPSTGKTILKFFLYRNTEKANPQKWLLKK